MYAVVRRYRFDLEHSEEIDHHVRIGIVHPILETPGFVAYYWVDTGDGEGVSLSVFQGKAGADEGTRRTADYIQRHLDGLLGAPEIIEGEVKAHAAL